MPKYPLEQLESAEFERLSQSLTRAVLGNGAIIFGAGKDGAREATFKGRAPYPSISEQWSGDWVVQAKFHDLVLVGAAKAREAVLKEVASETKRIVEKHAVPCDNYILITNVPLTGVRGSGNIDQITERLAPAVQSKIKNLHVWGYDDVCRYLDLFPAIRQAYLPLLTVGDMLGRLMSDSAAKLRPAEETLRLWLVSDFQDDRFAQLDQAGDVSEDALPLQQVFIDLDVELWNGDVASDQDSEVGKHLALRRGESTRAMPFILHEKYPRIVFVGGPGQGKTTLGQMAAQVHRGALLRRLSEVTGIDDEMVPVRPRLPFRIVLRDFAQWITESDFGTGRASIDQYVALEIARKAANGSEFTIGHLHDLIKGNPSLAILDGLDEVVDPGLRKEVLRCVDDFVERCQHALHADMMVITSTRPNSYRGEFESSKYVHLELEKLTSERAELYARRWLATRSLDEARSTRLMATFKESANDRNVELLVTTPLQVNIILYVILSGGRPARQRESLFTDYVDVIYKRERAKHRSLITTERDIILGLHEYLAYILHVRSGSGANSRSTLSTAEFSGEVFDYLHRQNPFKSRQSLEAEATTLVDEARLRLVLIVESPPGHFGFELRSIQEYFAGSHLARTARDSDERFERFFAIATSNHWRNTALFFAGRIGRSFSGEAPAIAEACRAVDRSGPDLVLRRGAGLALDLASDRVFGSNALMQRALVEYAASSIRSEAQDVGERAQGLRHAFAQLDREDRVAHLLPVLASRAEEINFESQCEIAHLIGALHLDPTSVTAGLLRYIDRGTPAERRQAFVAALSAKVDPDALKERFGKWLEIADTSALESVGRSAVASPIYFAVVMSLAELDDGHAMSVLKGALEGPNGAPLDRVDLLDGVEAIGNIPPSKGRQLVATLLRIAFVDEWAYELWDGSRDENNREESFELAFVGGLGGVGFDDSGSDLDCFQSLWVDLCSLAVEPDAVDAVDLVARWERCPHASLIALSVGHSELVRNAGIVGFVTRALLLGDVERARRLATVAERLRGSTTGSSWDQDLAKLSELVDGAAPGAVVARCYGLESELGGHVEASASMLFPEAPQESIDAAISGRGDSTPVRDPAVMAGLLRAAVTQVDGSVDVRVPNWSRLVTDTLRTRSFDHVELRDAALCTAQALVSRPGVERDWGSVAALMSAVVAGEHQVSAEATKCLQRFATMPPLVSGSGVSQHVWFAWRFGYSKAALPSLIGLIGDSAADDELRIGTAKCLRVLLSHVRAGAATDDDFDRVPRSAVERMLDDGNIEIVSAGVLLLALVTGDDLVEIVSPLNEFVARCSSEDLLFFAQVLQVADTPSRPDAQATLMASTTQLTLGAAGHDPLRAGLIRVLRDTAQRLVPMTPEEERRLNLPTPVSVV